jgi:sugar phosphate permease
LSVPELLWPKAYAKGLYTLETHTRAGGPRLFYGWIIVAVSFVTLFLVVGTRFSLGIFYLEILEDYSWTRGETAGAFSTMLVVHAVFSLAVGVLFDRLGPRKLFPLAARSARSGIFTSFSGESPRSGSAP